MRCLLLLRWLHKGACGIEGGSLGEGGWKHDAGDVDPEPIATGGAVQIGKGDGFPDVETKSRRGGFSDDVARAQVLGQTLGDPSSTRTSTGLPDAGIPGTNPLNAFILRLFKDQEMTR